MTDQTNKIPYFKVLYQRAIDKQKALERKEYDKYRNFIRLDSISDIIAEINSIQYIPQLTNVDKRIHFTLPIRLLYDELIGIGGGPNFFYSDSNEIFYPATDTEYTIEYYREIGHFMKTTMDNESTFWKLGSLLYDIATYNAFIYRKNHADKYNAILTV